ncbi:hypothetical protein DXG01_001317 [Tephrocybe rancida]|nr:hypothetical protein DXG01_001317 [Tephrocybe rancida]
MGLRHAGPQITGIAHITIRIDPEKLAKTVDEWVPPRPARTPVLLVAMHACGSLTPDILHAALPLPQEHHWYPAAIVAVGSGPGSFQDQAHPDPTTPLAPRLASPHLHCLLGPVVESVIILDRVGWLRTEIAALSDCSGVQDHDGEGYGGKALAGYQVDYVNPFDQAIGSAQKIATVALGTLTLRLELIQDPGARHDRDARLKNVRIHRILHNAAFRGELV